MAAMWRLFDRFTKSKTLEDIYFLSGVCFKVVVSYLYECSSGMMENLMAKLDEGIGAPSRSYFSESKIIKKNGMLSHLVRKRQKNSYNQPPCARLSFAQLLSKKSQDFM
jgi:hypothetical protein